MNNQKISDLAVEIKKDWVNMSPAAKPYVEAMMSLVDKNSKYGADDGDTLVLYFLSNASTWRGETARRIKSELKRIIA